MSISYSHLLLPKRKPRPKGESELTARDVGEDCPFLFILFYFFVVVGMGEYIPKTKTAFHICE